VKENMRTIAAILILLSGSALAADNQEKAQKKELEVQAKTMTAEAERLEKGGQLAEARAQYAESQSLIEVKGATEAIKRLDEDIQKRVKEVLTVSHKLYESRKFKEAGAVLEEGMKFQAFQSVLAYDLGLCYFQLGERSKAVEYLRKARGGTAEFKRKQKLMELETFLVTGENGALVSDATKDRIGRANRLADGIGMEASLDDDLALGESSTDGDVIRPGSSGALPATPVALKTDRPANQQRNTEAVHRSSLCDALGELSHNMTSSPSTTFNLANCAERNGRTSEAVQLLKKYLEMSPNALDAQESRARIADLQLLLTLPEQTGIDIRRLYALSYGYLAERSYDRSRAAFAAAGELAPDFAPTKWNLALLDEAMGNMELARQNFASYQQLTTDPLARDEAELHLSTLSEKKSRYDEEVDAAEEIISDLFNRAMNLTFNGGENRSGLRARRARVKKKADENKARSKVGGFAIPFAYAQQQLMRASEHLQVALALLPLGAEANELMGLVLLQANDGHAAIKSFDAVASQNVPVSFYAEMRGHKLDHAVKCELNRDHLRLIFLSSYDKKGKAEPPDKPAGSDGLGDMTLASSDERQPSFESLDLKLSDIKKVETDKGLLKLKLTQQEITLSPIYLPTFTPIEGPQARRFANNYTRLFVRYPGLEDSKLGTEGMSGGEKFKMGYNLANAGLDIATSGFTLIGAISSVQDAISIAQTIRAAKVSLSVSLAAWEKSVDDQQQLLHGKAFKAIPAQPVSLAFVQDLK
jgi:tetratricopeptide (TPR) repeat protein